MSAHEEEQHMCSDRSQVLRQILAHICGPDVVHGTSGEEQMPRDIILPPFLYIYTSRLY